MSQAPLLADPVRVWTGSLVSAGLGLALGWLFLWLSRRQDRKNFVHRRAPALPVRVLADHDDAWLRGSVSCDAPLSCPWFGESCVFYDYRIEKKVTRTTTDSKGNTTTTTSWENDYSESDATDFELVDEDARIVVRGREADFDRMPGTGTDYEHPRRRHSATILPLGLAVSALGVKLEDKTFGPLQEVPLLVSTRTREAFLAGGDTFEAVTRFFGFLCLFLGGGIAAVLRDTQIGLDPDWIVAVLVGLAFLAPFWCVSTYNRIVRARQMCEAAWRQIDVDLLVRSELVPNLVSVVEGYKGHERGLFERVAELRAESEHGAVAQSFLMLKESYPELESNELFLDLHDRLWALEEKIAASRDFYNKLAKEWNDLVQRFPTLLFAAVFGHRRREFFNFRTEPGTNLRKSSTSSGSPDT